MAGIEERAALEVMKPATGFIGALLEKKIEKVRAWSAEKDLEKVVEPESVARLMRDYLIELSHKVNEMTSIAFPQMKLDISQAYEPLYLVELKNYRREKVCFDLVSHIRNEGGSYLIVDGAGMGKSTFAKYLISEILFKCDRIPVLFDLRKLGEGDSLIEAIAKEVDQPGKSISRDVFFRLVELGKFVLVLDGFDEIKPIYQEHIAQQITELSTKAKNNSLVVTSRPQDLAPELLRSKLLGFQKFSVEQAKSLALRYDKYGNTDVGKRLLDELSRIPKKFIETPLLVSILYRTYGVNNSIADRISTFYCEIYDALYKGHDIKSKNGFCREKKSDLDFEDFRLLLRAMCYYMSVLRKTAFNNWSEAVDCIEKASRLSGVKPKKASLFLDDLLVSVPLMTEDGKEIKFLHKTILEYFSSEYIAYHKNNYDQVKKIFNSSAFVDFGKVFEFLYDISPSLYNSVVTRKFAEEVILLGDELSPGPTYRTVTFRYNIIFGFWSPDSDFLDEYEDKKDISIYDEIFDEENFHNKVSFDVTAYTSQKVLIDEEELYLIVAFANKNRKFHGNAWSEITDSLVKPIYKLRGKDIVDIGFNIPNVHDDLWYELNEEMFVNIKHSSDSLSCLLDEIILGLNSFALGNKFSVLSYEKSARFLNVLDGEERFLTEIDELLDIG